MSTPLSVLSFGSAPPPSVAQLPAVPLNLLNSSSSTPASTSLAGSQGDTTAASIDLAHVARTVLKAKRVAVVCGAGISTASGIPDFRSGAGLFESLKKQYPDAKLSSGKDLFDVGLFASESNAAIFFNMIAELKKQTDAVQPTAFHSWLKHLDDDGKLFRVYTQNIDALEEKAGLTYGLGDKSLPLPPRRKGTAAPARSSPTKATASSSTTASTTRTSTPLSSVPLEPTSSQVSIASTSSLGPTPRSSQSPPPATHSSIPRVIPLHGHLSTLSCSACKHEVPLAGAYVDLLSTGSAPICPQCLLIEDTRVAAGERSRGVGMMRPDVVLYGEEHKDGDRVGEITQRDLMGQRPDLLIVVGTTLKVKGTKRLVRELAKVIRPVPQPQPSSSGRDDDSSATSPSKSQQQQQQQRKRRLRPPPIHTLYLNYDFPTPSKEWAGVFDCWLRGDIQEFVEAIKREEEVMKKEAEGKEKKRGEKRKREEQEEGELLPSSSSSSVAGGGGKAAHHPAKRSAAAAGGGKKSTTILNKGKGKATLPINGTRKPLVPSRNANPPSPLRPQQQPSARPAPPPPPPARTDPVGRTRSSLLAPFPPFEAPISISSSSLPWLNPGAPVSALHAHGRRSVQMSPELAERLAAPSSAHTGQQLPFNQVQQQHSVGATSSAAPLPTSLSTAVEPASSTRTLDITSLPRLPSSLVPTMTVSAILPAQDSVTANASASSAALAPDANAAEESEGKMEAASEGEEAAEEGEKMVVIPEKEKPASKGRNQQQQQVEKPSSARLAPRRSMSTRSSGSTSDSTASSSGSQGVLPPASSLNSSSLPIEPPPFMPPRRRSSRSSTASATHASFEQDAVRRSTTTAKSRKSLSPSASASTSTVLPNRPRTRSSFSPPDASASASAKKAVAATNKLAFKVTKATVANVTGTTTKKKKKAAPKATTASSRKHAKRA
ncbi:hypothetical protein JCM10908_002538 [Rhodotorula pacifica]|uniref:uncharacterized protein n=1 Tax=Rhodotorula pacifica TaxID=1495444 RepID=UPI003174BBB5